jgi:hypothetical protein
MTEHTTGVGVLMLALGLASGAAVAVWLGRWGIGAFLAVIATPVGAYASLVVPRPLLVVALAATATGPALIGYLIYSFVTFPWSG